MREPRKKSETEEMLVVHKQALKPDPNKAGRHRGEMQRVPGLEREELAILKKRMSRATDPSEKRDLLGQIQRKFGNEKAAEVVRDLRKKAPKDDLSPKPKAAGPKKGKA
jgi:hypothetical protein